MRSARQRASAAATPTSCSWRAPGRGKTIYGFNRGSGAAREVVLFEGDPLSPENRTFILDRELTKFRGGVREGSGPEVANLRITPVVQSRGSPGKGDLPMMRNVAGTMIGAGEATCTAELETPTHSFASPPQVVARPP